MANKIIVGPILGFRGLKAERWQTSALIVTEGDSTAPAIKIKAGEAQHEAGKAILLKTFKNRHVWRIEWQVDQIGSEQAIDYTVNNGAAFRYIVPERGEPLRLAYGSCCGFSHPKYMKGIENKNAMWCVLDDQHKAKPYHLLLMGGDQIYSDSIWELVTPLKEWFDKSIARRVAASFTKEMDQQVEQFYFDTYCQRWSQKEVAGVMTQIPSMMMWDDHDIFDGWGSYPKEQQESKVFQGIYKHAREHFRLFQLQAKDDLDLGEATLLGERGFTYAYTIGNVAIIALDMRSERTQNHVMSLETWNSVYKWMNENLAGNKSGDSDKTLCKHLLVMSSIPVVYVNSNMLEATFGWLPGQQDLEDDFKDQWVSTTHQGERLRLIHRLLKFSKDTGCRATIVSGDVHVAALGYIQSERDQMHHDEANVINQLISSGMVHTPPAGIVIYMMEKVLGDKIEEVDRGITARMLKFPGTAKRFIAARNWLSLTLDDQNRIWAQWYAEGEGQPFTKVIHPVGANSS